MTAQARSLRKIVGDLFPGRERFLLGVVFGMAVLSAVFETLGVASIVPFMSLVLDPTALERYPALAALSKTLGAATPRQALLMLGGITVGLVAVGNAVSALNLYVQVRFVARTE